MPDEKVKNVLVVEDSRSQMALIRAFLRNGPVHLVEATDGATARARASEQSLDAILLDWELPDTIGPEILRDWQEDPRLRWVPVIMMTTHTDAEMIRQALDLGAVDFVRKPLNPVELDARLRSALRIQELQERLRREATHDPLTGLLNRRALSRRLAEELGRASRYDRELSVALLDIDHFKRVNDEHGHDVGDLVLQGLSAHLLDGVRTSDLVARWGGEEFLLLLPETALEPAGLVVDRLRARCPAALARVAPQVGQVCFSAGVASLGPERDSAARLIKAADEALYAAKHAGRNRVQLVGEKGLEPLTPWL